MHLPDTGQIIYAYIVSTVSTHEIKLTEDIDGFIDHIEQYTV